MPTFSDILDASPDVLNEESPAKEIAKEPTLTGSPSFQSILEASPDVIPGRRAQPNLEKPTFLGEFGRAAVQPIKSLAASRKLVTGSDEELGTILQEELARQRSMEEPGIGAKAGDILGGIVGGVGEFAGAEAAGSAVAAPAGPAAPFVGLGAAATAFGASGAYDSFVSAGVKALAEGKPVAEAVKIGKQVAKIGGAVGAATALVLPGTVKGAIEKTILRQGGELIPQTASALAKTVAKTAVGGAVVGGAGKGIENVAESAAGLDVSPTEGVVESALIMGGLPVLLHAKELYRQARTAKATGDTAKSTALQQTANDVAEAELEKVDTTEEAPPEPTADNPKPKLTPQQVAQNAVKRRVRQWQESRRAEKKAARPTVPGTEASQQIGAGQSVIDEIRSKELFTRQAVQDYFGKTGARVPSNEEASQLLKQAWRRSPAQPSVLDQLFEEKESSTETPATTPGEVVQQAVEKEPLSKEEPEPKTAVENRIIEKHRQEAQSAFDTAVAAGNKPEIRNTQKRLMQVLKVQQAPTPSAKPAILPKPELQNVPRGTLKPEVPETAPEEEKGISVIDEIKSAGAKSIADIQRLFPQAQLNREAARKLRDEAWGKQAESKPKPPEEPPAPVADTVEKPPPNPPVAPVEGVYPPWATPELAEGIKRAMTQKPGEFKPFPEWEKASPEQQRLLRASGFEIRTTKHGVELSTKLSKEKRLSKIAFKDISEESAGSATDPAVGETTTATPAEPAENLPPKQSEPNFYKLPMGARGAAGEYWTNQKIIDTGIDAQGKKASKKHVADLQERQKQVVENFNREKGKPDALQPETAQPVRDVLEEPGKGAQQVPADEAKPQDDEGGRAKASQSETPSQQDVKLGQWPESEWSYQHLKSLSLTERANRARYLGLRDKDGMVEVSPKKIADRAKQRLDEVKNAANKPKPTEAPRVQTLTPAIVTEDGKTLTGPNHAAIRRDAAKQDTDAITGSKEGFVNDKGEFVSRQDGAKWFEQKTGKKPATEGELHSEDLRDAGLLEHLPKPSPDPEAKTELTQAAAVETEEPPKEEPETKPKEEPPKPPPNKPTKKGVAEPDDKQGKLSLSAVPTGEGHTIESARAEAEKAFGKLSDRVSFVHEPDNPSAAYTDRNKIVVNAAKVAPGTVGKILLEEGLHGVWNEPSVQEAWKQFRNGVTEYEIAAERSKRKGLDTSRETLKEEAAIAKLLAKPDAPLAKKVWDAVIATLDKLFGVKVPDDQAQLLEAARSFLTGEESGEPIRVADVHERHPQPFAPQSESGKYDFSKMTLGNVKALRAKAARFHKSAVEAKDSKEAKRSLEEYSILDAELKGRLSDINSPPGQGLLYATPTTSKAPIEQYTDALKDIKGEKRPLREQFGEAFDVGSRLSKAKDAFGKGLDGLKATGDFLIQRFKGIERVDDLLRAKGMLSEALETRGRQVYKWVSAAKKAVPQGRYQAAIRKWVDAGGDMEKLKEGARETKPQFRRAYEDAQNLSPDHLKIAQETRKYHEARLQEAIDAGVLEDGVADYIHRMYERKPELGKKLTAFFQSGILKTNPSLIKQRVFELDWQAEREGFVPNQSFIDAVAEYETSLSRAIAARQFVARANELIAPDGRPVVDIKGVGIPITDEEGKRSGTLIKPQFNPQKANVQGSVNYRGDYVNREYPALSKWKWVSSDAGGKPIFVQGDVGIHPDYVQRFDALLEPSKVRYGKYGGILRPALAVSSVFKQTMLDLSGFHQVQIAVHAAEHKVMPWNIAEDIDFQHPDTQLLLRGGMTIGGEYHYAKEGLIGSSLIRQVPILGPLAESYHEWLFRDFIPRVKYTMARKALERNRERYAGKMSEEQIAIKTATQANDAFGGQNAVLLERSKTAQDIARLIMLAPDFLESRAKFAASALAMGGKRFSNEQRSALLLGALTMYATARIINQLDDGQPHLEPENAFSWVHNGQAYSLRTVQGDIMHALSNFQSFAMHRLNPVFGRTAFEFGTGRDEFGRKRAWNEQLWDTVSNIVPISLRSSRERSLMESLFNAFGVTNRRWQDTDDAFKLARKWKDKHGIGDRGEFIYDPDKDPLRGLKIALSRNDDAGAAHEIAKVLRDKTYTLEKLDAHFTRYADLPFTGSKANDKKFIADLTEDEKQTVEAAKQHKSAIGKLYRKARGQYKQALANP